MAAKRKTKAREAQLAFEALSIEGGLLSPEWLSKVAQLQAGTQAEADYRIPKGLNLRDEIGRYWRIAQAHWADFKSGREAKADTKAISERFVLALLRDAFGFMSLTAVEPAILAERSYPIGYTALGGRVPVVIAPADSGLDALASAFGEGSRKRSVFGLAQEYLNAQEGALWGIVSDGTSLRVVRDNASLTRPAWIEADLQRIFTEERYADFAALWLLCHETRFGREGQAVTECTLEAWRNAGREEGTRAREHLRRGVEEALITLGQGFLSHAENQALRADLQNGTLPVKDYFNQLLRLVYRLIFLLTAEERGLLHPDGTSDAAKALYTNGYGMRRLRERSVKRSARDRFSDLWEATKMVCRCLGAGEPRLGLPALAGIFATNQCPTLDASKLENRALLLAVFKLAWLREDGSLSRVNWRDMGPEELGSVYESLLELVPRIAKDERQFAFATGGETKGNARKTTGSYYTPDSLVQVLLDSALEPVIADTIAKNPGNPIEALLGLSIVDPACGSGHFILAAARRLAAHVARFHVNGTPSAAEYRHALRQVVGRCIFGVDLNPMAVELCKVGLWMEAVEPGLPLTFLNSHIQHGNALLGTTPELMAKGIPDAAWDPIEGDDKKTASSLKKRNKKHAVAEQMAMSFLVPISQTEAQTVTRAVAELDAASDVKLEELTKKEERWDGILGSPEYRHQKFVADAWCAAFVWPKQPGELTDAAPTNELWRQIRDGQGSAPALTAKTVGELAEQYRFFHWHLQFPQVFARGGFDVVLGNPPWEKVKLQEQEFFATRSEEIATAANAATRKMLIAKLPKANPQLWADWCAASRRAEGESHSIRQSGRYPMCGKGDVNTYAIFAEHNRSSLGPRGRAGFVVPTGLATDDTTKEYFSELVSKHELFRFYSFENEEFIFPGVHHAFKFALLAISRSGGEKAADLTFFARTTSALADLERHFSLAPDDFETLNPNTRTCPTFRSRRDAEINLRIYRAAGILLRDDDADGNPWKFRIHSRLWHMAEDADAFHTADSLRGLGWQGQGPRFVRQDETMVPLVEAKMLHHFDHRFGTYAGQSDAQANQGKLPELDDAQHADPHLLTLPHYWVDEREAERRLAEFWTRGWLLGWRKIARSTDQRTMIAVLFPKTAAGDAIPLAFPGASPSLVAALYANLCTFALDYCARQKVGGTNVTFNYVKQFPVLSTARFSERCQWADGSYVDWLLPRVRELVYTAWDLEPFARDVDYAGTPFRWDAERRFRLRCELDAAFFHLYAFSRDEVDYVMETFPVVRRNDEKAHGEYRTKRVILDVFDELTKAAQIGKPYRTSLDPLPGTSGAGYGTFSPDGTPRDYAEALRMGLLFTLIRCSGEGGISSGALSRALLWLRDSKHATSWLDGTLLADFERIRESDPLIADGTADSQSTKLLEALENEKAITQDGKGIVRLRARGSIPNWLPQTPTLARLASVMLGALERAEQGAATTPAVEKVTTGRAKRA
ncbi:Eco57I restriction-modification methylase domain-containing protein [Chondromyces apiculatus]|uniref:site-specific DNA-methyltransferase (adenine-specific) n=1 Tax=Chondromyces apiculatus DSM 436 TaxID=1192034 RepID=A0A017TB05_9BACT|nr:N-6 DNA methylase [Chondromyces apiculatus]EYF06005.1 putative restriction /modification enzyme [Chondromyces apiculatus DSM 436]